MDAKLFAARVAETLTTSEPDRDPDVVLRAVLELAVPGVDVAAIAAAAVPLGAPGMHRRGRVVYPQLGGLDPHVDPRRCSVMVVVEIAEGGGGDTPPASVVTRCLDIRLRRDDEAWRLESLGNVSDAAVARPGTLTETAARVLEHPRIALPDSVRWDIHEGVVDERVLSELSRLADDVPLAITTCRRGHPANVFGTSRRSAHSAGRAVDVWRVGEPVVSQHTDPTSVAHEVAREIAAAGHVRNFGSPWSFPGGRSFTDPVHLDHLHLGF